MFSKSGFPLGPLNATLKSQFEGSPYNLYLSLSVYLSLYLSISLSIYLSTYLPTYLSIYLSLSLYVSMYFEINIPNPENKKTVVFFQCLNRVSRHDLKIS